MRGLFKNIYSKSKGFYHTMKFYYTVNWTKTLYFNFKKFPFRVAKKLPVFFYGKVRFTSIIGDVEIQATIEKGMIGFGQPYEMNTLHKGIAEIIIVGKMIFKGNVQFGKDYFIYVGEKAVCEMGHMASIASNGKLICVEKIVLGNFARLGAECQIMDTNFHQMIDTETGEKFKMNAPIQLGSFNYIGNRVSIMQNTITPDFCTIASNSLVNSDYCSYGNNILIGGLPAKLIKRNISRDWESEKEILVSWMKI